MTTLAIKGDVGALIRQALRPGEWAIDGGAGDGTEAEIMAACVGPQGKVYAIEPDERRHAALTGITARYPWVLCLAHALGAEDELRDLHRGANPEQSSLHRTLVTNRSTRQVTHVLPLDTWADARVRCVKLDLQGHEVEALRGAPLLLAMHPTWIVECWPYGLKTAGASASALVERFRAAGYVVQWASGHIIEDAVFAQWLADAADPHYVNLLAVPA